ncbi:hypothetical protein D3C83_163420 [compost metagenome]
MATKSWRPRVLAGRREDSMWPSRKAMLVRPCGPAAAPGAPLPADSRRCLVATASMQLKLPSG